MIALRKGESGVFQVLGESTQVPKCDLVSHTQSFTATKEAPRSPCS